MLIGKQEIKSSLFAGEMINEESPDIPAETSRNDQHFHPSGKLQHQISKTSNLFIYQLEAEKMSGKLFHSQ